MAALRAILLALLLGLAIAGGRAQAADIFGRPEGQQATEQQKPPPNIELPAPLRPILATVVEWQTKLNAAMRGELLEAREGTSIHPALMIVLFAFLYGVAHALGPGHGKVVIGSYFLTRRANLINGVAMSVVAALVQAISAIVLVGALALVLQVGSAAILSEAATIEIVSYGAIVVIGLWMAWGVISGRKHDHGHDGHGHGAHDHDHTHNHKPVRRDTWRMLATGAAVGLRPCSGAILVLLFSLANGIVAIGVLATFAMAAGVAITVTTVSVATLSMHRGMASMSGRTQKIAEGGYSAIALGGALLIALFGILELVGVWTGAIGPSAG